MLPTGCRRERAGGRCPHSMLYSNVFFKYIYLLLSVFSAKADDYNNKKNDCQTTIFKQHPCNNVLTWSDISNERLQSRGLQEKISVAHREMCNLYTMIKHKTAITITK